MTTLTTPKRQSADWPTELSAECFRIYLRERRFRFIGTFTSSHPEAFTVRWENQIEVKP